MDWNPALIWIAIALLLGLAELSSGGLVLLALAVAAVLTSALAALGLSLPWQLLGMGIFSGLLVPLAVMVIRPWFSPRGVAYGTTGTGVEKGRTYTTLKRDFDGASGVKVNGDFYRLRVDETGETDLPENTLVIFKQFEGTTAIVSHCQQETPAQ
ncbi:NfeD family protein [Billgrantia montanilacus]|uniref:Nodulation efficiency, NfeD-like protein n=1 Tax=Billgrantia montanilacus TaxID=2282305 RepID=A0A368TRG4_9GAMM|nr:nodulation efficiency, NfeD-like protein [Halomonas montanilacus]RCV87198.1 nodulation efficiency, NfeD-like protein [Halomonas montanilacus]